MFAMPAASPGKSQLQGTLWDGAIRKIVVKSDERNLLMTEKTVLKDRASEPIVCLRKLCLARRVDLGSGRVHDSPHDR